MRISGGTVRLLAGAVFCVSLLAVGGCTKYASPDDLKQLDIANTAAVSAEKTLDQTKAERQKLERKIPPKQAELDAAKAELEKVKNK